MQLFYEIFPVFLFFIAFKFYDIYMATIIGIVATLFVVIIHRILQGKWDRKQLVTLVIFLFFGGMTLYFHDPIFVKWKPTIIFWIFTLAILGSQLFTKKPLIQRLLESVLPDKDMIPVVTWKKLNMIWAVFFASLGSVNLYIAYYYNDDVWVNFKFYGVTGALFLLSIFQVFYLMRYISPESRTKNDD